MCDLHRKVIFSFNLSFRQFLLIRSKTVKWCRISDFVVQFMVYYGSSLLHSWSPSSSQFLGLTSNLKVPTVSVLSYTHHLGLNETPHLLPYHLIERGPSRQPPQTEVTRNSMSRGSVWDGRERTVKPSTTTMTTIFRQDELRYSCKITTGNRIK